MKIKGNKYDPVCVCEGNLIADEPNTKVLIISSMILDEILTKEEFDALELSEQITRRQDDL